MIVDILTAVLLLSGSAFFLVAAIGIVRLPDLYMRMHAAAKASAFGAVLLLLGVALHFGDGWTLFEVIVIVFFIFITNPVAAHLIGRAGYHMNVALWQETQVDELRDTMQAEAEVKVKAEAEAEADDNPDNTDSRHGENNSNGENNCI